MAIIRFPDCISFSGLWPGETVVTAIRSTTAVIEMSKQQALSSMELLCRLMSIIPWAVTSREKFGVPTTVNKQLRRRERSTGIDAFDGQSPRLRFRPYVGKVPWHTGVRAFLSQLFPRYGHCCGLIGRVERIVGRLSGISGQLIGWIFAAIVMTWVMIRMIKPSFWRLI